MIGASISGITFVSVPGMAVKTDMTYLQMCFGFIFGYLIVAFVLLPVYYRLNLTTIYTYLQTRLGRRAYKTGSSFFLLSKLIGAAVRFYGLYHPSTFRSRPIRHPFPCDGSLYGWSDMAIYTQRRHKNARMDRLFSNPLHVFGVDFNHLSCHDSPPFEP